MKITVHGSGYVGLVTAACFAHMGNDVLCIDVDAERIGRLRDREVPIHEPGLTELVREGLRSGCLRFSDDPPAGVRHGHIQFIAVGTPPDEDGSADLRYVLQVAETIALHMHEEKIVVDKSTVPVGTADRVRSRMLGVLEGRDIRPWFDVVSNPEFLKEGAAVKDFMHPDRIVIGAAEPKSIAALRALYAPFNRQHDRMIVMRVRDAEFTKYAANAMLAARISLMNELANLAERLEVDIEAVRIGIGSDPRIGYQFIYPGAGYGGSCFPKDVQALIRTASDTGYEARMLRAAEAVNHDQKQVLFQKIRAHYRGALRGKVIALWGLAFKPGTNDMREAPSRILMEALWAAGASVRAYDPEAMDEARRIYGDRRELVLCDTKEAALDGADALAVVTEWPLFRSPDYDLIRSRLRHPVIFDGRNLYDPRWLAELGIAHYAIGRPTARQAP
jgi:UDPglucose 6-dehydrogenase